MSDSVRAIRKLIVEEAKCLKLISRNARTHSYLKKKANQFCFILLYAGILLPSLMAKLNSFICGRGQMSILRLC